MKINKTQLKSLIKECLVEIFSESFSSSQKKEENNIKIFPRSFTQKEQVKKNITVPLKEQKDMVLNRKQDNNSHNNIMMSILEDTAKTTLKNMSRSDYEFNKTQMVSEINDRAVQVQGKKNKINMSGTAEDIVENNDPTNLFGQEASNKWLKLAFIDNKETDQ